MLEQHPTKRKIIEKFIANFDRYTADKRYWGDREQAFRVAGRLNRDGYLTAGRIVDRFIAAADPEDPELDTTGSGVLLKLGGKGLTAYAEHMGALLRIHGQARALPYFDTKKMCSLLRRFANTETLGTPSPDHVRYLEYLRNYQPPDFGGRSPRFSSYQDYLTSIYAQRYAGRSTKFFATLGDVELRDLRERLRTVDVNSIALFGLLAPFETRPYPGDVHELLELVGVDDRRIVRGVADILAAHQSARIRAVALRHLRAGYYPTAMVRMLGASLQKGDDELLVSIMRRSADQHELHQFGYGILANCDYVSATGLAQSLRFLYYSSRCGVCRENIVRHLLQAGKPGEIAAQLRYDSYKPTRKLLRTQG